MAFRSMLMKGVSDRSNLDTVVRVAGGAVALAGLIGTIFLTGAPAAEGQAPLPAIRAQLNTAWDVSDLAQQATTLPASHRYLRQTVNCMEGPRGKNFTPAAGNPCQRYGNGILVDLEAVVEAGNVRLGKALRYAQAAHVFALEGLASAILDRAQTYARIAAFDIGNALEALD